MMNGDQEPSGTAGIRVEGDARVGDISIVGDVAGRDVIKITEDLSYDVSALLDNPYLGLASFTYATRAFYGGREAQAREVVSRLTEPGEPPVLVFITGTSGSGKSSFARAGVVPALKDAYAAHRRDLRWSVMRPGRRPIEAFGRCLQDLGMPEPVDQDWPAVLRTPDDLNHLLASQTPTTLVNALVLDQFEELFTQAEPTQREAAFALLSGLDPFSRLRTHIIATLRSDYLPNLFAIAPLFACVKRDGFELRAMSPLELARAIRQPLLEQNKREGKGKRLDPGLVDRLVGDVGVDAALLPLVQVTLRALWDEPPHKLVLDRYRSLTQALEVQADRVLEQDRQGHSRSVSDREQIINIFLDLVEVSLDDDPNRDVRRTVPKADLIGNQPNRAALLEELVDARLLATRVEQRADGMVEEGIDIIHETLLGNWPRLREAIRTRRDALQQGERFRLALRDWLDHNRDERYFLEGARLAVARELAERGDIALRAGDARTFLSESIASAERARRRALALRLGALGSIAILTILALSIGLWSVSRDADNQRAAAALAEDFANQQRSLAAQEAAARADAVQAQTVAEQQQAVAEQQARIARSRQLAAQALSEMNDRPDVALLLGAEAYRTDNGPATRGSLLTALLHMPRLSGFLNGLAGTQKIAFSADGRRLATAEFSADGSTVRVWDVVARRPLTEPFPAKVIVQTMAFSPDGRLIAAGGKGSELVLLSADDGHVVTELKTSGNPWVNDLAFNPDGSLLAGGYPDNTVVVWDVASHAPVGQPLARHTDQVMGVAFSRDGSLLASASLDSTVRLWNAKTLQPVGKPLVHPDGVWAIAFSPDGRSVVTGGADRTIHMWDVETQQPIDPPLVGHTQTITSLSFSPDGRALASSAGTDGVLLWDVDSHRAVGPPLAVPDHVAVSEAFSPTTSLLAAGSTDGVITLWDTDTDLPPIAHLVTVQPDHESPVAFSPDGQVVAYANPDHSIQLWDVNAGSTSGPPLLGHTSAVTSITFSQDGSLIATGSCGQFDTAARFPSCRSGEIRLWRGQTREQIGPPLVGHTGAVATLAFSPDNARIVSVASAWTNVNGSVIVWDVQTRAAMGMLPLPYPYYRVRQLAFSSDGQTVTAGGPEGAVQWSLQTPGLLGSGVVGACVEGCRYVPDAAALSWNGKLLAISTGPGADYSAPENSIYFWDIDTQRQLDRPLRFTAGEFADTLAFSPDGQMLASGTSDGGISLWDVATRQRLGTPLAAHGSPVADVVFSSDGRHLVSRASPYEEPGDHRILLWDVDPQVWTEYACRLANRNLRQDEWLQFIGPDVPYHVTCPMLSPGDDSSG